MIAPFKPGEPLTLIVPPRIQAMMCGCVEVQIASGNRCCAIYSDGTKEYALVAQPDRENFFALVGQIQDAARCLESRRQAALARREAGF